MHFDFNIVYLITSILISCFISVYAWQNTRDAGSKSFAVACFTSILWMIGDVVGRISQNFETAWTGELIRYLGVNFLPVALLVFIHHYCGKRLSRRTVLLLCVIPTISWLFLLTNLWHSLFFTEITVSSVKILKVKYGAYFLFVHLPYSYALWLWGFGRILIKAGRASRHYRQQLIFLLVALSIPFCVNIMGVLKLFGEVGYTPHSFFIFFLLIGFAMFRYRLLSSNPIAYQTVFHIMEDGILVVDKNGIVTDFNASAARIIGKTARDITGLKLTEVFSRWGDAMTGLDIKNRFYAEIETNVSGIRNFFAVSAVPLPTFREQFGGSILTLRDVTDRLQYQEALEKLAYCDPLTQLANRRKFHESVRQASLDFRINSRPFSIVYIDLNRFKSINDTFGHEIGDKLLMSVAERISENLRKRDLLARFGGDEFAVLLLDCDEREIRRVMNRILASFNRPVLLGDLAVTAELSLGAAICPNHGEDVDGLIRRADAAMYSAKRRGGGYLLYDREENKNGLVFSGDGKGRESLHFRADRQPRMGKNDK